MTRLPVMLQGAASLRTGCGPFRSSETRNESYLMKHKSIPPQPDENFLPVSGDGMINTADDKTKKAADRRRIDLSQPYELAYWSRKFGV